MESRKNFVINTAFYGILIALALAFWQYLLPILMPFIIGFAIASVVQLPLHMIHLKGGRMQGGAAVALCIVLYGLLVWGMIFFSVKVIGEICNFPAIGCNGSYIIDLKTHEKLRDLFHQRL